MDPFGVLVLVLSEAKNLPKQISCIFSLQFSGAEADQLLLKPVLVIRV